MEGLFKLLNQLLAPLDGYKTKIAAVIAAFLALNGGFHFVDADTVEILIYVATALGFYGVAHRFEKDTVAREAAVRRIEAAALPKDAVKAP